MFFIWLEKGDLHVHSEYRIDSVQQMVTKIFVKQYRISNSKAYRRYNTGSYVLFKEWACLFLKVAWGFNFGIDISLICFKNYFWYPFDLNNNIFYL